MFASEGDLHLELPTGEREALKELWVGLLKFFLLFVYNRIICIITGVKRQLKSVTI